MQQSLKIWGGGSPPFRHACEGIRIEIILTILDEHFGELQPLFKTHEFHKRTSVGASAIVARKSI